jgi:hypothetical protein
MLVLLEASDCETHFSENVHSRRSFRQWTNSAAPRGVIDRKTSTETHPAFLAFDDQRVAYWA